MKLSKKKSEFVAGYIGGCCGISIGHPIDTLKVRLQTSKSNENVIQIFLKTLKKEKIFGLFKGLSSPVLCEGVNDFLLFGIYGYFKNNSRLSELYFPGKPRYTRFKYYGSLAFSAMMAGMIGTISQCFSDLIKIQLQTNYDEFNNRAIGKRGFFDCVKYIVNNRGVSKLFHGYCITLLCISSYSTAYFVTYEYVKNLIGGNNIKKRNSAYVLLLSGGIAGMSGWTICYPSDYYKSRVQADLDTNFRKIIRSERFSLKKVYKGFGTALCRAFPMHAITFYVYEKVIKVISV